MSKRGAGRAVCSRDRIKALSGQKAHQLRAWIVALKRVCYMLEQQNFPQSSLCVETEVGWFGGVTLPSVSPPMKRQGHITQCSASPCLQRVGRKLSF